MTRRDDISPKMQPKLQTLALDAPAYDEVLEEQIEHFPGEGYRVTLFNDDHHSVDEVVAQLIKALACPLDVAVDIMMRAHTRGSAVVIIAEQTTADRVAGTLRQIDLRVAVELV